MKKNKLLTLLLIPLFLSGCSGKNLIPHYHYYDPSEQVWTWDYNKITKEYDHVTITLKCANLDDKCDKPEVVLTANIEKYYVNEPNCCEDGLLRYTATANFEGTDYIQSKDIVIDRTAHDFSIDYFGEKDGHVKKCLVCGSFEGDLLPHNYGSEGTDYYTCDVCHYHDEQREKEYERLVIVNDMVEDIDALPNKDYKVFDMYKIDDVYKSYNELDDVLKMEVNSKATNNIVAIYNAIHSLYSYTFDFVSLPEPFFSGAAKVNLSVTIDSDYGPGILVEVTTAGSGYIFINTSTPEGTQPANCYWGIKNNTAESVNIIVCANYDYIAPGNNCAANSKSEVTVNETRTGNIYTKSYTRLGITADSWRVGTYFISNLYGIL